MHDWFDELQQKLQQAIDQAASELDQQCDDAINQVDLWLTETFEAIDTAASEFVSYTEPLIPSEARRALDEFEVWLDECDRAFDASLDALIDVLLDWDESSVGTDDDRESGDRGSSGSPSNSPFGSPFDSPDPENDPHWFVPLSYVRPTAKQYPACQNCQHYHGYRYGEHVLVCAMHPYGWEDEQCPDWESEQP
jgi:hypothetical protein